MQGKIEFTDISTPLTIEHYLPSSSGGAIGLDVTPARFIDKEVIPATQVINQFYKCVVLSNTGDAQTGHEDADKEPVADGPRPVHVWRATGH